MDIAVEGSLAAVEGSLAAVEDSLAAARNPAEDNQAAERIPVADRAEAEQILENKYQVMTQNGWHYNALALLPCWFFSILL